VLRRAGWLTIVAAIVIALTDALIGRLTGQGASAGWTGGLLAPLQTAAIALTGPLILPTAIRVLAHAGPMAMPVTAARATVAGVAAGLCCTGVGLAAGAGSVLAVGNDERPITDVAGWVVAALLSAGALSGAAGVRTLLRARAAWAPAFAAQSAARDASRPDLLDDLSTLLARLLPGSATARSGAWLNRRLDEWTWSPRRYRAGFVLAAGSVAGVVLTGRHAATSGPWTDPLALVAFALLVSGLVAAALGAAIAWLGLLRPQPRIS